MLGVNKVIKHQETIEKVDTVVKHYMKKAVIGMFVVFVAIPAIIITIAAVVLAK